jgi:hypothetical protein
MGNICATEDGINVDMNSTMRDPAKEVKTSEFPVDDIAVQHTIMNEPASKAKHLYRSKVVFPIRHRDYTLKYVSGLYKYKKDSSTYDG